MATRKRIRAFNNTASAPRRAPDGSAFIKCGDCGFSVAVALMDMHCCKNLNENKEVKRVKANIEPSIPNSTKKPSIPAENTTEPSIPKQDCISEQPRSAFMFFVESYSKSCGDRALVDVNREAFEKWKKMTSAEKSPYILEAWNVENAYVKKLRREELALAQAMQQVINDEADSVNSTKKYGRDIVWYSYTSDSEYE